jgi:hypothetical protein
VLKRRKESQEQQERIISSLANLLNSLCSSLEDVSFRHKILCTIFEASPDGKFNKIRQGIHSEIAKERSVIDDPLTLTIEHFGDINENLHLRLQELSALNAEITKDLANQIDTWKNECLLARQLLKITSPLDLTMARSTINDFLSFVEELKSPDSKTGFNELEKQWKQKRTAFEKVAKVKSYEELKKNYGLSETGVTVLKSLMERDEVPISELDLTGIEELKQIRSFYKLISLRVGSTGSD